MYIYDLQTGGAQREAQQNMLLFGRKNHILAAYLGFCVRECHMFQKY